MAPMSDSVRRLLVEQLRSGLAANLKLADFLELHTVGIYVDMAAQELIAAAEAARPLVDGAAFAGRLDGTALHF